MKYLFDTNILLIYLRSPQTRSFIEEKYRPFDLPNIPLISVVSEGEIRSLALRNHWGSKRLNALEEFLQELIIIDINAEDIIHTYAEIDTFSQGKLLGKPLNMSSRNMGKNDLWIAASASVTDSTLLTTDADFEHLDGKYLDVIKVDLVK